MQVVEVLEELDHVGAQHLEQLCVTLCGWVARMGQACEQLCVTLGWWMARPSTLSSCVYCVTLGGWVGGTGRNVRCCMEPIWLYYNQKIKL